MNDLVKTVNNFPLLIKLLLCIPAVEIVYGVLRIINEASKKNWVMLVVAILTVFPGAAFMWLVDVVCVLLYGHAFLLG